jgi:hypothetical protein
MIMKLKAEARAHVGCRASEKKNFLEKSTNYEAARKENVVTKYIIKLRNSLAVIKWYTIVDRFIWSRPEVLILKTYEYVALLCLTRLHSNITV